MCRLGGVTSPKDLVLERMARNFFVFKGTVCAFSLAITTFYWKTSMSAKSKVNALLIDLLHRRQYFGSFFFSSFQHIINNSEAATAYRTHMQTLAKSYLIYLLTHICSIFD